MIEERSEIKNLSLYSENRKHRYLLARVWVETKPIPLFVSKCSGEAEGISLELTNTLITNNLYTLGCGGYYSMVVTASTPLYQPLSHPKMTV